MKTKKQLIEDYLKKCDEVILNNNEEEAKKLEEIIIFTFDKELKGVLHNLSTYANYKTTDYIYDINLLKAKLENIGTNDEKSSKEGVNLNITNDNSSNNSSNNSNNNTNTATNNTDLKLMFEEARKKFNENEYISPEEKNEVIEKIDEIEEISESVGNRSDKWDKLKSSMEWLGTKGVATAKSILELITSVIN